MVDLRSFAIAARAGRLYRDAEADGRMPRDFAFDGWQRLDRTPVRHRSGAVESHRNVMAIAAHPSGHSISGSPPPAGRSPGETGVEARVDRVGRTPEHRP